MPPAAVVAGVAPPIVVTVAAIPAAEKPVLLPATHSFTVKTSFLGYSDAPAAGGVAQKRLTNSQAIRAFGRRCKLSTLPGPGGAPAPQPGILRLALGAACWSRVLQELVASGLLNLSFDSLEGLDKALDSLVISNPANLTLTGLDLDLGEDTQGVPAVAAVAAVAAVGRRGTAGHVPARRAVAAVQGHPMLDPAMTFLSGVYVAVPHLEIAGIAPWANVAYLCGALGPCLTQSARNGMGPARMSASAMAVGMSKAFNLELADHLSLAGELPNFLTTCRTLMPSPMRCTSVIGEDLRVEFRDTILYGQSPKDRVRVETQRVHTIGQR